jgi:ATP-binding cassette subfamily F protein uup
MILVTHDRFMMDRVSTIVLGLDGLGDGEISADYSQWETWQRTQASKPPAGSSSRTAQTRGAGSAPAKKKLSYLEAREFAAIEERIAEAEQRLHATRVALEDPSIASDGDALLAACAEVEEAQKLVNALYARWSELEQKQS